MAYRAKTDSLTHKLLVALVAFDATIAAMGLLAPGLWFAIFHGDASFDDPHGLLARSAGGWLAFALVQLFVALRWKRRRELLLLVAGVRLGDCLTDLAYLATASDVTALGSLGLAIAGPANVVLGVYFYRAAFARR